MRIPLGPPGLWHKTPTSNPANGPPSCFSIRGTSSFSRTWFSDRAGGPSFFPRPNRPALKDLLSGGRQILRACGAQDDRPVPFAKSSPPVPLSAYAERGNDGTDCVSPLPKGEGIKGVRIQEKDRLWVIVFFVSSAR